MYDSYHNQSSSNLNTVLNIFVILIMFYVWFVFTICKMNSYFCSCYYCTFTRIIWLTVIYAVSCECVIWENISRHIDMLSFVTMLWECDYNLNRKSTERPAEKTQCFKCSIKISNRLFEIIWLFNLLKVPPCLTQYQKFMGKRNQCFASPISNSIKERCW